MFSRFDVLEFISFRERRCRFWVKSGPVRRKAGPPVRIRKTQIHLHPPEKTLSL
jgi:hypothetical protein